MDKNQSKNKKNAFIYGIIAVIVLAIIAGIVFTNQGGEEKIKIGMVIPLSGSNSLLGESYVKGAELFLKNNKEKQDNIKIVSQDGKLKGKASVSAAKYLLNIENVDIISTLFHLPAKSISPVTKEEKTPLIYEAHTRSIANNNSYAFKSAFDALTHCEKLAKYAKQNNEYNKLGVLMAETEYNKLCLKGMKKVEPNIEEYWYKFGSKDFKTLLTKMNNDNVDTLATIMLDNEYSVMFKQLSELGYPIDVMCATASECITNNRIENISNKVLNNTLSIDFIPNNIDESSFGESYKEKHPKAGSTEIKYAAMGYEMMSYTTEALKDCTPKDRECIKSNLKEVSDYSSILGSNSFNKNRILQIDTEIYKFNNGEWQMQ